MSKILSLVIIFVLSNSASLRRNKMLEYWGLKSDRKTKC